MLSFKINFHSPLSLSSRGSLVLLKKLFKRFFYGFLPKAGVICISEVIGISPGNQASLVAQMVKRLPAMHEIQVLSLGWENPLEKEMATHSSILAWRIPRTEKPGAGYSPWVAKSRT